ncbi:HK97 family phage prohead protease [Virgibacillus dokdonensis]|uniref:HK97 family phage prohead protease n=1 Tax=Virgibacillus dokdonensis TaxID=302167 RepID=UPI00098A27A9|nr:HK97 family phage prohead protease [Virgibacillus dokdonensis]
MGTIETRITPTNVNEDERTLSGYAVKWNRYSSILKRGSKQFKESIRKGAFLESLLRDDQFFFMAHDSSKVLGRKSAGTLSLKENGIGLHFRLYVPDTSLGNDLFELVRRRDLTGISIGFRIPKGGDEWDHSKYGLSYRTVHKAKLTEISAVALPAYEDSEIHVDQPISYQQQEAIRQRLLKEFEEEERKERLERLKIISML